MFRLTIIIPAFGCQEDLDNTLVSVLENRPSSCEILVPHGPSYRDPYDLSDEVRFVAASTEELIPLINAGIKAGQASMVHILQAGCEVTPGWTRPVLKRFAADASLAAVSPRTRLRPGSSVPALRGIRYVSGGTRRDVPLPDGDPGQADEAGDWEGPSLQAGFFRRWIANGVRGTSWRTPARGWILHRKSWYGSPSAPSGHVLPMQSTMMWATG